nr:acyloxyacyl hydrolase [uncultured Albidiferax sp.]
MVNTTHVTRSLGALAVSVCGWACGRDALAAEPTGPSVYLQGGQTFAQHGDTRTATIGVRLPGQTVFWDGRVTLAWDVFLSHWKVDAPPGALSHFTQIGLVPMFRYRFDGGQSPWFVEAGVGISYLNEPYQTPHKSFSTQWNFSDHLGVGRSFGAQRRQELGLVLQHVSNASLRSPNPGETFLQLRYSYGF